MKAIYLTFFLCALLKRGISTFSYFLTRTGKKVFLNPSPYSTNSHLFQFGVFLNACSEKESVFAKFDFRMMVPVFIHHTPT